MDFAPGIYFGLPDTEYHAIPALSSSGIKKLRISTLDFWARSWLNKMPKDEDLNEESDAKILGKAYHARILEGRDAFLERFAPDLDPADFPGALKTATEIAAELRKLNESGDVRIKLGGKKEDLAARLIEACPTVRLWDVICDDYAKRHPGKEFLAPSLMDRIEFTAAMIEKKPDLKGVFRDGMPEVSVCYICPDTEVPCKLRMDYLKPRCIADLKSFANTQERPISDAIAREFGNRRMPFQAAWYLDGARYIPDLIKAGRVFGDVDKAFLQKLAQGQDKDFKFVFLQKGPAPVARGRTFKTHLAAFQIAKAKNDAAKILFRECLANYPEGAPWVDMGPTEDFTDEELPLYSTD